MMYARTMLISGLMLLASWSLGCDDDPSTPTPATEAIETGGQDVAPTTPSATAGVLVAPPVAEASAPPIAPPADGEAEVTPSGDQEETVAPLPVEDVVTAPPVEDVDGTPPADFVVAPSPDTEDAMSAPHAAALELPAAVGFHASGPGAEGISLSTVLIAERVVKRQAIDTADTFTADVGKLYCFTELRNMAGPTTVTHTWYLGAKKKFSMDLEVGKSKSWRTWTTMKINDKRKGHWTCAVTDAEGTLLGTHGFTVE